MFSLEYFSYFYHFFVTTKMAQSNVLKFGTHTIGMRKEHNKVFNLDLD